MSRLSVPFLLLFSLLPLSISLSTRCICPASTLASRYASSTLVVRARVISVSLLRTPPPPPCLTQIPPCLIPQIIYENVLYKLRVQAVFRGCPPSTAPLVFVTAFESRDICSFRLRKGQSYMLNLGVERDNSLVKGLRSYSLVGKCQGHRRWRVLAQRQKSFLRRARMFTKNQCVM